MQGLIHSPGFVADSDLGQSDYAFSLGLLHAAIFTASVASRLVSTVSAGITSLEVLTCGLAWKAMPVQCWY